MRILFLSQLFDPEPMLEGLTAQTRLAAMGHQVEVLTGFPNYPGGKIYPGHRRKLYKRELQDGIVIHRVWLYPSHDRSAQRRVWNYASFALMACLIGPFVIKRPDAVWAYHPPLTTSWPARWFKLLFRAPFVYHIHDLWPDTLAATGMVPGERALRFVGRWADRVYRSAAHIVVISPGFKELLEARGVPADKLDVIYTWCEEGKVKPALRDPELARELGLDSGFNVMFAGNMGLAQALDSVLDAAAITAAQETELEAERKVRFVFVGNGVDSERLERRASEMGLANVLFLPRRPFEAMGKVLSLADVLLIHLKDDPLFAKTVPSKTQTYMYMGVPILAGVRGDAADLVTQAGAAVSCEPENPQSLADAVLALAAMPPGQRAAMGQRGREFYDRELSMDKGLQRVEQILTGLQKKPQPRNKA